MGMEHIRNVKTGEIRAVETTSDEYADLINEVYDHEGSARPKWEITGMHHTRRLDNEEEITEEDHGYEHKPIPGAEVDLSQVGPEKHPERALTEAEIEAGIESYEHKLSGMGLKKHGPVAEPLVKSEPDDRADRGKELAGRSKGNRSTRPARSVSPSSTEGS